MNNFTSRLRENGLARLENSEDENSRGSFLCTKSESLHHQQAPDLDVLLLTEPDDEKEVSKEKLLLKKLLIAGQRPGCRLSELEDSVRPTYILTDCRKDPLNEEKEIVQISLFIPSIFPESKIGFVRLSLCPSGHTTSQPFLRSSFLQAGIEQILAKEVTAFFKSVEIRYPYAGITYKVEDNTSIEDILNDFFRL